MSKYILDIEATFHLEEMEIKYIFRMIKTAFFIHVILQFTLIWQLFWTYKAFDFLWRTNQVLIIIIRTMIFNWWIINKYLWNIISYQWAKEHFGWENVAHVLGFELDLFLMLSADLRVDLWYLLFNVAVKGFITEIVSFPCTYVVFLILAVWILLNPPLCS